MNVSVVLLGHHEAVLIHRGSNNVIILKPNCDPYYNIPYDTNTCIFHDMVILSLSVQNV